MASPDLSIEKYVDGFFLPHFRFTQDRTHAARNCSGAIRSNNCSLCQQLQRCNLQSQSGQRKLLINQDDIDLLELMDPKITPDQYMKNILKLYKKEENLRSREDKNQPMQQALSTRRILNTMREAATGKDTLLDEQEFAINHHQQQEQEREDKEQINRLRDACYLGLGKMIVNRKETENRVELSKSNYHTRQYLLPHVREEIARLEAENEKSGEEKYYLMASANSRGISFEVDKMPGQLSRVMEFSRFRQTACTINQIIQKQVYQYKMRSSISKKTNPLYYWLWGVLVAIVTLLLLNSQQIHSQILQTISLVLSLCLMIFILMFSCHRFNEELDYVSLIDLLNARITEYLNYLNSRPGATLHWNTTAHLYWIEITPVTKS